MSAKPAGFEDFERPPLEAYLLDQPGAGNGADHDQADSDGSATPKHTPLVWDDLEGREPPAREWIIPYWIPAGHVTLLAGRGGIGKTLIAQHIGSAATVDDNLIWVNGNMWNWQTYKNLGINPPP